MKPSRIVEHNLSLGLCFVAALAVILIGTALAQPAPAEAQETTLADLPLLGQYAISKAMGKDQPAYHVVADEKGFQAVNVGNNIVADFQSDGMVIQAGAMRLGFSLVGFGSGDAVKPAEKAGKPMVSANRIEYRRGLLTEWYVNGPLGLQQGFTVDRAPEGGGKDITLVLELEGDLVADVDADGTGLTLRDSQRVSRLRYAGLTAYDASERTLKAALSTKGREIQIRVKTDCAKYPIVIDPIFQKAKLLAKGGGQSNFFGGSVSISGNTLVIGANSYSAWSYGGAYIFVKPSGGWCSTLTQTAFLQASDRSTNDHFGFSVSIDGNTVVVGAIHDDDMGTDSGSAYVFVKPTGGWASTLTLYQSAKLLASDGAANDWFGCSVSIDGNTIVVGARADDAGSVVDQGSAYVFVKPTGGWASTLYQTAKLLASDGAATDYLGCSVSIDGNTIVAGARADDGNAMDQGSAYVFVQPTGGWASTLCQTAKLLAIDGAANDSFGSSVSIDGNTVVVGAYRGDGMVPDSGSAYVFVKPASGWTGTLNQTAKLLASDGAAADGLGNSISISGDTVVVGAYQGDGMVPDSGSAYVFVKPASGWTGTLNQTAKFLAFDGAASDRFGCSVSISGKNLVVGANGDDDKGTSSGSAYVYDLVTLTGSGTPKPGNTMNLDLTAVLDAGLPYQIGSSLGTGPIPIDTRQIGLTADVLLWMSLSGLFPTLFQNYAGYMDAQGMAKAALAIPPESALVGYQIHSAFVTLSASAPSGIKSISNTYSFKIQ